MIVLSPRLAQVAAFVPPCRVMADIGTDHAYVPLYLLQEKRIVRAIASDIHEGPAARASAHCLREGAEDRVSVRVGPGLLSLSPGEAEGAVIAGMGGLMIQSILSEGAEVASAMEWLVLQPQNHAGELRQWLCRHGYVICNEALAAEGRMLYQILFVRHGEMPPLSPIEAETGLWKFRRKDALFPVFLQQLIRRKDFTIRGAAEDAANPVTRAKREKAVREKKELEDMLWKFGQKM